MDGGGRWMVEGGGWRREMDGVRWDGKVWEKRR